MTLTAFPTRLLVVHSDLDARTFLRRRFSRLGHRVVEASNHAEALSLIAKAPLDLVFLDLATRGQNGETGFDLLRRMRERRTAAELPILALAGEAAAEEVVEALAAGADDCLMRPLYFDVAQSRAEMLIGRSGDTSYALQAHLEQLQEAAGRTEAVSAVVAELGRDVCASFNGLLGAASALTRICQTPELKPAIDTIEEASAALDLLVVRALGRPDRRVRTPKAKLHVLVADDDAGSRLAVRELLNATEVEVVCVEVSAGLDATTAMDSMFFDLIMMSQAAPEAIAGVRAVRRSERQNKVRRTPILVYGAEERNAGQAIQAGADLYVRMPLTAERVLTALAEALVRESEDVRAVA
jgi:DNA-binding response OmpR family regulator